jgi:peptidyl-prolyl cis-trans isomerase SurA
MKNQFLLLFVLFAPVSAYAAEAEKQLASAGSAIAAVVNDEVVTSYDVDARTKFIIATAKISPAADSIAKIRPQIVRSLIDERLQLQEAKRNGIVVDDKEVTQAITGIESQRGMPPGTIGNMLKQGNIPLSTFTNQVRANVAWSKLISKKVRSSIRITDEEIDLMAAKLSVPQKKQELEITILQLPVDKPSKDAEMQKIAEKLVLEVRGGANFEEVARQFAGGAARENGKLPSFWVRPEQLDPVIAKTLMGAKPGFISNPLKNNLGYAIIKVYNARDIESGKPKGTEITFRQISLKLRSSASEKEANALQDIAQEIAKNPGTCQDKTVAGIKNAESASISVDEKIEMLDDLSPALKVIAEGMKVGDVSSPLATDEGISLYMLCGKREGVEAPVDKGRAKAAVFQNRMELEAQKYMRNLRRDAFIEVKS